MNTGGEESRANAEKRYAMPCRIPKPCLPRPTLLTSANERTTYLPVPACMIQEEAKHPVISLSTAYQPVTCSVAAGVRE